MSNRVGPEDEQQVGTETGQDNTGFSGSDEATSPGQSMPETEAAHSSLEGAAVDGDANRKKNKKHMQDKEDNEKASYQTLHASIDAPSSKQPLPPINANTKSSDEVVTSGHESGGGEEEDEKWLTWLKSEFIRIAGEDKVIDRAEFKTALQVKESYFFADRFFDLFDRDHSGTIDLQELLEGLDLVSTGSHKDKLKFLFDVFDVDGSGSIDMNELKEVLRSCMEESSLKLSEEKLDALTVALFTEADEDGNGSISYAELIGELEKHPHVMDNLSMGAAQWLKPPEGKKKKKSKLARYFSKAYILNNKSHVIFIISFILINVILFAINACLYRANNGWVIAARGSGMCLNFNSSFVLVLMLRHCLTWLSTTSFGSKYLPIDKSVEYHKMVGITIAIHTVIHTVGHLINIHVVMKYDSLGMNGTLAYWEYLLTLQAGIGFVGPGFAFISGVVLDIVLFTMVVCSLPYIRKNGYFQLFYWTHLLYWVFWIFLILHAKKFGVFFAIPGVLFIIEKIYDLEPVKTLRYGRFYITEVNLLPSRVTHLVITVPEKFYYEPGDYIFIRIPAIARNEWHPFTISSAPEMPGSLWLHIRAVGHWTNKLYDYFDNYDNSEDVGFTENGNMKTDEYQRETPKMGRKSVVLPLKLAARKTKYVKIHVHIDGPYGTPTRDIFQTEHAVLIGSGIGITPYASILQSVMYKYRDSKQVCPHCSKSYSSQIPESVMKVKKVDFIWINRNQTAFEWFVSLLTTLESQEEAEDKFDKFFDMQLYMTAALKKSDIKGLALQMALDIIYTKEKRDIFTGLRTHLQAGRPDWAQVFKAIHEQNKGRVTVYFCGAPAVADQIKNFCDRYGFRLSRERF